MHISDVVWVAAIPAAALLFQTWLTNRRDDRRLASEREQHDQDRQHDTEQAEQAHVHDLQNQWRDRRFAAHAEYLAAAEEIVGLIEQASWPRAQGSPPIEVSDELTARLLETGSRVELLGGLDSGQSARALTKRLQSVDLVLDLMQLNLSLKPGEPETTRRLANLRTEARDLLDTYRAAARRDLGTDT